MNTNTTTGAGTTGNTLNPSGTLGSQVSDVPSQTNPTGGSSPTLQTAGDGRLVTGLFPDRQSAEAAFHSAHERGYGKDDVNLAMSDETRQRHFGDNSNSGMQTELGNKAAEGAGIGGAIGGTIGAVLAGIAAMGTALVLPGLGLVVAGPLAAAVAGAGAGAAGGGLIGALIGWGMPEERVKHYESGIKNGGILMGLRAKNDEDASHLETRWREHRGEHVYR